MGPSRLRKRFVQTFLFAGLIPLVLMGAVSFYLVRLTHQQDVSALEQNISNQVATEIKRNLDVAGSILELRAIFDNFAPIAFDQQSLILEDVFRALPPLVEASFICTTPLHCSVGVETSRWVRKGNEAQPELELRNRINDPQFAAVRGSEGRSFGEPIKTADGKFVIPFAAPVFNKNSEVIAILAAWLDLSGLVQDIVANANLGQTGYVYAVMTDGTIVAHRDPSLVGETIKNTPIRQALDLNDNAPVTQNTYESLTGVSVSGSLSTVPDTALAVVAEWPKTETQALIDTIILQILTFAFISFFLLAIISSWMALKLIEPIAQLRIGTSIIGGGNFDYQVHINTGDELEDLGKNLNRMAQNLKGLEEVNKLRLRTELLSESLRKEREVSKLKDQFITTVSHQFNTPLSVINWSLDTLRDPKSTQEQIKETTEVIYKSQRDIAAIVADLLTLSEIGFRYQKDRVKQIDIAALADKVLEEFQDALKIKKITAQVTRSGDTIAEVNEFTMRKVIENLVDNAIAYSNEGGVVTISIEGAGTNLNLNVSDHGIGIPKDEQPLIFQQFFRAKNAIAKKNVGTGLGLFITKSIVAGHGGKISFTSSENQGTMFFVTIPKKATIEQTPPVKPELKKS